MSNSATIKVALTVDDQGAVRRFRNIGDEAEKAGRKGRDSFDRMDERATGFDSRLVSIKSGVAALAASFAVIEAIEIFNKINEQGMAFESTMKRVAAVSRATQEVYADLEAAAREAGATTEWQASQAAQALQFEAMAGMAAKDAIQGLPDLLDLATAAQVDLGVASDIVTDNLTAFNMHISELSRLNDAFINTTTRSNTTVQMLGESFKYTAPVAAQLGYNVEQTAAYLGIMANSGIKASDAGTDLRQILLRTADAAETLGLSAGATLIDVLEEMYERQMSANEVTDLFGILASKSAMVLMNNVDAYRQLNQELEEGEGATRDLAARVRDSAENDWKVMNSAIDEAGKKMYALYQGDYRSLIREITEAVKNNAEAFESLGHAISGVLSLMEKVVTIGGAAAEKVGHIGELVTLNAQAQGMASGGLFSRNLIDGTSFEELKGLVELGEKAMSNDYLERITAEAELLKIEIDYLEGKLSGSIFYPQGARDQLTAMKADYEEIQNNVEQIQSLQKDSETLNRLADAEAALKQLNAELEKEKSALNAVDEEWAKESRIQAIKDEEEARSLYWQEYITQMNAVVAKEKEAYEFLQESKIEGIEEEEKARQEYWQQEIEMMNDVIAKEKKAYEKSLKEQERAQKESIRRQQRAYESLFDTVQGYTADILSDWGNAWDTLKDIAERTVAELAATFATQKLIMPVVLSVGSAMGLSWEGTSFQDIANVAGYGTGSDGIGSMDLLSMGSSLWNAFTGTTSAAAWDLTYSVLSTGMETFGASAATASAAASEVAGMMATVAPYLAIAAVAVPIIMDLMESSPTPAIGLISEAADSPPGEGEINSLLGLDYRVWLQDVSGRTELGEAIAAYFDSLMSAVDEATSFSVAEALEEVEFDRNVELDKFNGDTEAALAELTNQVFKSVSGTLVSKLVGTDISAYFGTDFFESIQAEAGYETLFEAYAEFATIVEANEDFKADFLRQVGDYGESAHSAYENLKTISVSLSEVEAGIESISSVSSISTIVELTESWKSLITTLEEAHATTEQITQAQTAMAQILGANITGLTADALASALAQGGDIGAVLDASITGAAYSHIARTISDSYLASINETIGQVWIDTDGDIPSVIEAMRGIDTTEAQAEMQALIEAFDLLAEETGTVADDITETATDLDGALSTAANTLETALGSEISTKKAELTLLEDNLDTARDNYLSALDAEIEKQEEAMDAASKAADTFRDLADSLAESKLGILTDFGGDPSESYALAKELYEAAVQGAWNKDADSMAALPDLATAYLEAGKSVLSAVELNDLTAAVYRQLSTAESIANMEVQAQEEAMDTAQDQLDVLEAERNEVAGMASTLLSLEAAADDYYAASLALNESSLEQEISTLEAQLAELRALNSNVVSLAQARTDYNVAQVAVDEASGSYTFNEDIYLQNKLNQLNSNADSADVQAANQKYGNTDGVWTMSELEAVFAQEGLTAKDHYDLYGYGEGVSPYVAQSSGYADGGIASGPATGYYELLHGTEAIIPLGKGAIPLVIQSAGDDYGQQLVYEVVEFREKVSGYLGDISGALERIEKKFEIWERKGIKLRDAS